MNRLKTKISLLMLSLILLFTVSAHAKSYYYKNIEVRIDVQRDGSFWVSEKMTFRFNGKFSYAYRDIEKAKLRYISDIQVIDEVRQKKLLVFPYHHGNRIMVKWKFKLHDTDYTWTVKYKVHGGLGFFATWDELWWNAIFHDRTVPVQNAVVYVNLPGMVSGSEEMRCEVQTYADQSRAEVIGYDRFLFSGRNIAPRNHFTIVAGWPRGLIDRAASERDRESWFARTDRTLGIFIPVFVFIFMFNLWWRKGRDRGPDRPIVAEFKPPENIKPALAGVLIDEKVDMRDIIALLVDLAIRGYMQIEEIKPLWGIGRKDYKFTLLKDYSDLEPYESLLLSRFFPHGVNYHTRGESGALAVVKMSDLKNKFYTDLPMIRQAIYDAIAMTGYFVEAPEKTRKKYGSAIAVFVIVLIIVFYVGATAFMGFFKWYLFAMLSSCAIVGIFGMFMPARTEKGTRVAQALKGFKLYLYKAERFRLGAITTKTLQETFEKYLPYAILFGVEKQWTRRFANIQLSSPQWYVGGHGHFSPGSFGSGFSSMVSSMNSSMTSSPSSSSGFGGGNR